MYFQDFPTCQSFFVVNDGYLVNIQDMEQVRLRRLLSIEILEFDLLAQSVHGRMGTYQHSQRIVLVAFVSFCHVSWLWGYEPLISYIYTHGGFLK